MTESQDNELKAAAKGIKAELDRAARRKRRHADFFGWHDKESKHWGIAADFCEHFRKQYSIGYTIPVESEIPETAPIDPPDVALKDVDGNLVGVEITELVNEKAIDAQIRNDPHYFTISFSFNADAAIQKLDMLIKEKDIAAVSVEYAYANYLLLIHCAEPWLDRRELADAIAEHEWPATKGIHAAYLMLDYSQNDPYPIFELFSSE